MNKVMLIGNVGADPQVKYLDQGVCVAQVRLATTERGYTLQNGTQVPDRTEWHTCIFWRKQAETVEKYVHKGDKLYVEGKLQSRDWTDRQGVSRRSVEVMVDNMEMLTPRGSVGAGGEGQGASAAESSSATQAQPIAPAAPAPADNNGEYPF